MENSCSGWQRVYPRWELVSLSNRKSRLEFAKIILKEIHAIHTILYNLKPMSYGQQRSTKVIAEEYEEGKKLLSIQNVWLPMEQVSLYLLMMWLLKKTVGWMHSEGCIIWVKSAKCPKTHWTGLHSADRQWTKANQDVCEGKKSMLYSGQVIHQPLIQMSMHFTYRRQNWRQNTPRTSSNWRQMT